MTRHSKLTLAQAHEVLGLPPPVVYPTRPAIDRDALTRAALAKLTPEQNALGEAGARGMREDAAYRRFRAQILGPIRGESTC